MPLIRCSEQKRQTLEEFYTGFITDKVNKFADCGTHLYKTNTCGLTILSQKCRPHPK
jgi:hypothetical protein